MSKVLEIRDYRVYYKTLQGYVKAVDGVNLTVYRGEILGLIGESGSGKSTLAQSLVLPKPPMAIMGGSAKLSDGIDLAKMGWRERRKILLRRISIIPQFALDALPEIKKIKTFVRDLAVDKKADPDLIMKLFRERLRNVNLPIRVLDMYPMELSGGMRQRVVIALSTLFKPEILIADEPTSALDVVTQKQILKLFVDLRDQGIIRSLIFITHDIASIRQIADRIAVMYAGKIVEVGETEEIVKSPLHPYTSLLIRSVPPLGVSYRKTRLRGLMGAPPNLLNPPPGCRFAQRCPYVQPICIEREPPLIEITPSKTVACWLHAGKGEK